MCVCALDSVGKYWMCSQIAGDLANRYSEYFIKRDVNRFIRNSFTASPLRPSSFKWEPISVQQQFESESKPEMLRYVPLEPKIYPWISMSRSRSPPSKETLCMYWIWITLSGTSLERKFQFPKAGKLETDPSPRLTVQQKTKSTSSAHPEWRQMLQFHRLRKVQN